MLVFEERYYAAEKVVDRLDHASRFIIALVFGWLSVDMGFGASRKEIIGVQRIGVTKCGSSNRNSALGVLG